MILFFIRQDIYLTAQRLIENDMELIIHRGTKEIGGSCVEVRTNKTRILVDFGIPLVSANREPFDARILKNKSIFELKAVKILPDIKGLYKDDAQEIDAVLLSHSHLDHYGLLSYINPAIPIYMSEGAKLLIEASDIFTPHKIGTLNSKVIDKGIKLRIGDFTITSYLVDHSAFDALAFLIETDGKRLFYSGDFRGHGRKRTLFRKITANPPKNISCLLMEGSMLGRQEDTEYGDEDAIQGGIEERLKEHKNITFLFASSQNIDRLVSAYKACLKTDSIFVIDIYTAFILYKLNAISKSIPQYHWKNVRVKFLLNQRESLIKRGYETLVRKFAKRSINMDEINQKKDRILMLARDNSIFPKIISRVDNPKGARIIYSMWDGYLTNAFRAYCDRTGLDIESIHTSGHATLQDLEAFSNALRPEILIPIHTFYATKYKKLFKNVEILQDRETFTV